MHATSYLLKQQINDVISGGGGRAGSGMHREAIKT